MQSSGSPGTQPLPLPQDADDSGVCAALLGAVPAVPAAAELAAFFLPSCIKLPVASSNVLVSQAPELADVLYSPGFCTLLIRCYQWLVKCPSLLMPGRAISQEVTRYFVMSMLEFLELMAINAPMPFQIGLQYEFTDFMEISWEDGVGPGLVFTVGVAQQLSLLFGEVKNAADGTLEEAWASLTSNLSKGFPKLFYGSVPYLPVFAAAGTCIQFGYLLPTGLVAYMDPVYDITVLADRARVLIAFVNLYRLVTALLPLAAPTSQRSLLHCPISRGEGASIVIGGSTACKRIEDCDTFFTLFGNSYDVLKAAYTCANRCPSLVHQCSVRLQRDDVNTFEVVMDKLGCKRRIHAMSEDDVKRAVRACLLGLAHFHSQRPPIVHCDVRMDNVMWTVDGDPFLTDLELAHWAPWRPSKDVEIADWEDATLDSRGRYVPASDVYQVGVMLASYHRLSLEGSGFAELPKSKRLDAGTAAQHEYLSRC